MLEQVGDTTEDRAEQRVAYHATSLRNCQFSGYDWEHTVISVYYECCYCTTSPVLGGCVWFLGEFEGQHPDVRHQDALNLQISASEWAEDDSLRNQ